MGCGDCCVGNCSCVNDSPPKRTSISTSAAADNEAHAAKIAKELASAKECWSEDWAKWETDILGYVNEAMDSLLRQLEQLNHRSIKGTCLDIDIESLKDEFKKLDGNIIGCAGSHFNDRLVQTDTELKPILDDRDDKKRESDLNAFCNRLQHEVIAELKKRIQKNIEERKELLRKIISERLGEIEKNLRQMASAYQSLLMTKKGDLDNYEKLLTSHIYMYSLCKLLMETIGEGNGKSKANATST